jgi:hypothetical protein
MMTARSEHNDTGLTTKSRGPLPKGLDFRITQSVNACVYNEEGNSMAKSKAPMQLDYRTFDDKELTQVRQTAHAVGPAAKEMFAMFARVKGSEPVVGDVIAGCKIDRIQKPEAPPRK